MNQLQTKAAIENILAIEQERNALLEEKGQLRADVARRDDRIGFLEGALAEAQRQRDFYMRHSTGLLTRLNDIALVQRSVETLIGKTLDEAKTFAEDTVDEDHPAPVDRSDDRPGADDAAAIGHKFGSGFHEGGGGGNDSRDGREAVPRVFSGSELDRLRGR